MSEKRYYLLLHLIILINSFQPTMVSWIENLNSVEIVFIRTIMAIVILGTVVKIQKHKLKIEARMIRNLILSGILMAIYWILLVLSTRSANASVTLVGIATSPLWVTFITPFILGSRLNFYQFITGVNAVFGIYMIYSNDFQYESGMFVAILAAFMGALLTVVNSTFAKKNHHVVVTFYQMVGACLTTTIFLPFYDSFISTDGMLQLRPTLNDILVVFLMAFLLSYFAYSMFIKVMEKLTPFTVALSTNLSPIYGILIALVFSNKDESMSIYFYSGAIIIVASVMAFPLVQYFFKEHKPSASEEETQKQKKKSAREEAIEELRETIEREMKKKK